MQNQDEINEMNRRSVIRQRMNDYRERLTFSQRVMSALVPLIAASGSFLTYICASTGNLGCAVLIGGGTVLVTLSSVAKLLRRSAEGRVILEEMEREMDQPVEQFIQQNPLAALRVRARRGIGSTVTGSIVLITPDGTAQLGMPEEPRQMTEEEQRQIREWQSGAAKDLQNVQERESL